MEDAVADPLIQQLFNVLQAANVEAVKLADNGGDCKALVRSLFFADGATPSATPLSPPVVSFGNYLIYYQAPGGETAFLTRAQVEVIMEFWSKALLQQLYNILQAANVEAVNVEESGGDCKTLVRVLFFASGATYDGSPLPPPNTYVGDYLIYYKDSSNRIAFLTRAQVEVIMEFGKLAKDDKGVASTSPVGCCTDQNSLGTNNVPASMCACPPNKSWSQSPCGGKLGRAAPGQTASERGHD
jgi:hypothetical protein